MTSEEKLLWLKIQEFKLDDENSSFKFSSRLARENGWSIHFSKKAIEEYKKFIFLCCIGSTGATPSDQVDQVWHLYLTYTRSYWIDFCQNTLNKELHHNPTKGGEKEGEKFNDYYTETLKLYLQKFNSEPPIEIWPENSKRFSDIHFQRVNIRKNYIFRKPTLHKKIVGLYSVLFLSLFFIQAYSATEIKNVFAVLLVIGLVLFLYFNNKNGNNNSNGSGCSSGGGCSSGHSGCSGCSSSGCSGCGGGGCGGD